VTDDLSALTLDERIRHFRRRLGITQKTLAELIGKSERWIVDVEHGRADNLRVQDIREFARALKVDVAKLSDNAVIQPGSPTECATDRPNGAHAGSGTLFVEHDDAQLRYSNGVYRPTQRRKLVNAGKTPITRFLVRINVDLYPGDPERSNRLYREHPLTWDELGLIASCEGEPMTWSVKEDHDAFKELYLRFESADGHQIPLYPGQSATIEYSYTVGDDKWGRWYTRAVRWPTRHLTVHLRFPASLDPMVWGTETTVAGEAVPLRTAIQRHNEEGEAVFAWATDDPPLHARYRLEWRFRNPTGP
jgi:transcriptional regulator with XRE-family HTH domain